MSQTGHNPSPSTCTSNSILDVNAESGDESQSMQVTSERKAVDGRYKADLNGAVTPRPQGRRLYDDVQESVRNKTKGDERKENQVSGKRRDIQEQTLPLHLLQELKKDVQELKEDVRLIKNRMDMLDPKCGENKTVETTLENPFEILRSFGFRANSLEETGG
ncbi:uncharacterized protein [Macrobrachium rosenbergii]|uniref:uncharacterized protein isoform X3 n=1 Tax=Macrobrachium rosenbergii TaxID=79674 RepID=UPI0034D5D663